MYSGWDGFDVYVLDLGLSFAMPPKLLLSEHSGSAIPVQVRPSSIIMFALFCSIVPCDGGLDDDTAFELAAAVNGFLTSRATLRTTSNFEASVSLGSKYR